MSTRTVSVSEGTRLARTVVIGTHLLRSDEPEPVSSDTGPTPGELLLAALGSCTSMAVRAYADRHSWPLHQVDVDLRFGSDSEIIKEIHLSGELEPSQSERLLAVAGRCPVHRLLTNSVSVVTLSTVRQESTVQPGPPA
ncbi:OsmC family protein [Streptomyces canus]|uniref:Redox protein n=1 Tax=Streptomyces canus TaxID=58343 RepID=A0AAW8FLJ9_9ACTN|nr:OsmC family protein [Streptomyces canus]MDQ0760341.1 putative redox protein [Streptomyces canus]MDQ0911011.1 putative redox protein [Streptomyces canus]MDQ1071030.1 putative redox protein [Streptomyces canus]